MARYLILQRHNELETVAADLENRGHVRVPCESIITAPFRRRTVEWQQLRDLLSHSVVDAVLTSPFFEQDLITAACLLAPLRAFDAREDRQGPRLKVALILPAAPPVSPAIIAGLTAPVPLFLLRQVNDASCEELIAHVLAQAHGAGAGPVLFVDDQEGPREVLHRLTAGRRLAGRPVVLCNFDDAYEHLLAPAPPAAVVTDTVECVNGPNGDRTGLALCVLVRSAPRLQAAARPVLFSARLFADRNMGEFAADGPSLTAFDRVFQHAPGLVGAIHAMLEGH